MRLKGRAMTYTLYIGDRTFSSWSLRGWLLFRKFDLPVEIRMVGLYSGTMAADMAHLAPGRTVPVATTPEGHVLTDSLAIAETLAERHPDVPLYPRDPAARALARSITAEMHSGFGALREACPHNMDNVWEGFAPSEAVLADLARIETLWTLARTRHGAGGPWLFGEYSIADAFYAPIANRITTYGLPVGDLARAYVDQTIADPRMRQWRAMGQTVRYDPFPYALDLPRLPWPGDRIAARALTSGNPENATCPYSGDPVTHMLEVEGRTFGFCNAFCRDKTLHDPAAWPDFMALLNRPSDR